MFTQVVGKLRLALSPPEPEWQHVALYVTASGLTTGPVPDGDRCFEADLDLLDHRFTVRDDDGESVSFGLEGRSVSQFHEDVLEALGVEPIEKTEQSHPLLDLLPASVDELVRASGLAANEVAAALTELEVAGLVAEGEGVFRRCG